MRLLLFVAVTAFLLNLFLPWWSIALPGLIFGYIIGESSGKAFGSGFLALFLLWGFHAMYIHVANDAILSTRIAEMLSLGNPLLLILLTGFLGGLISGIATLTGFWIKIAVKNKKQESL